MGKLVLKSKHRLLCGDATRDLGRLLDGLRPSVVITDPPYGIDLQNHAAGKERSNRSFEIQNDKDQSCGISVLDQFSDVPTLSFASPRLPWPGAWKQHLVWDKGDIVGAGGDPDTYWKNSWELIQVARTGKLNGNRDPSVLHFPVAPLDYDLHPMQKPVALLAYLLSKVSGVGDVVCEPFSGSGTTIIAAEQLNRRCFACEISPAYCDITVARYEQFTGTKAIRWAG